MPSTITKPVAIRLEHADIELLQEIVEKNPTWTISSLLRNFIHERCDEMRQK